MSPFAIQLKKIRTARNLQQKAMAELLGCEQSYLSALETDSKVPPQKEKLLQLFRRLTLSVDEESALLQAAELSKRSIKLPLKADTQVFQVCHALEEQLPNISKLQLELISLVLKAYPKEKEAPKM